MVLNAVIGAEMAMRDHGIPVAAGSGVAAAAEYLRATLPAAEQAPASAALAQVAAE